MRRTPVAGPDAELAQGVEAAMGRIVVYGAPWCPDCRRSRAFLTEQRVAFDWIDIDVDREARRCVEEAQKGGRTIPMIVFDDGSRLLEPTDSELAAKLGLRLLDRKMAYDVLILGGGPAGLSAAIHAAREGVEALVIDRGAPGGQTGSTDRIDNYPGFPDGIAGSELAARLVEHTARSGVEILSEREVSSVSRELGALSIATTGGETFRADAAIVATGSRYRNLGIEGEDGLVGLGVHYSATRDGPTYQGAKELVVVGGGNSALEGSLLLAELADHVTILARGEARASEVVTGRVRDNERVELRTGVDVLSFERRDGRLGAVVGRVRATGERLRIETPGAFVFVGLEPNTAFLRGAVDLDERGFVVTDDRYATSLEGVFAAGDVRAGSTKQVGSAAGEGIAAVLSVRRYLENRHLVARSRADE
jgi:thioredoxin reductase (NADPH)